MILGFGAVSIDDIIYVDRPLSAGKGRVTGRLIEHGGNVATALVAVARLGGRAGFIGWLNDGTIDDPSAADFEREGVDISLAPRRPDAKAIRSTITVAPDGGRFIAYDDAVPHGTSAALPDEALSRGRVLLIDGYATPAHGIVAQARALGLAVVADIEWSIGAATHALMSLADHLVLPIEYARAYTGEGAVAAMLHGLWSHDRAAVVLTDGERGSYMRQVGDAALWHIPAHEVRAVDTTGAGDCFHGAYALALDEGERPLDAALFATAASGFAVTGRGGRSALPARTECLAKMVEANAPSPKEIAQ